MVSFDEYIRKLDERLEKYIPPKKEWGPPEHAVYGVKDLYNVPLKKAKELQFKAIKYQFKRHYEKNKFYREFCRGQDIEPENIKKYEDLDKIPLLQDKFFKDYPEGRDFAVWLSNTFTGDLPTIRIREKHPTYDDVIKAFNSAGLAISHSSGTSGRHTFIPRDKKTFDIAEYALAKAIVSMVYPLWEYDISAYLLMPNPFKTTLFAGKVCGVLYDAVKDVTSAIDREITTETIRLLMSGRGIKASFIRLAAAISGKKIIKNIVKWLEEKEKKKGKIAFVGAPYILHEVIEYLKREGKTFDFSDRGGVVTGGGWKIHENRRLPVEDFIKEVNETLGIKEEHCLDVYAMVEGNGIMTHCPEGHYLHIPITYLHPMVIDKDMNPVDYEEYGRFAFLDGTAYSYPGFIVSGDRVRMLERCPVCDRPGPVLEPEIKRAKGEEVRGCAEEVRRMLTMDVGRDQGVFVWKR